MSSLTAFMLRSSWVEGQRPEAEGVCCCTAAIWSAGGGRWGEGVVDVVVSAVGLNECSG